MTLINDARRRLAFLQGDDPVPRPDEAHWLEDLREQFSEFKGPIMLQPGWRWLVHAMVLHVRDAREDHAWVELKSKHGALQVVGTTSEIVEAYETLSEEVCEVCGRPGKNRDRSGWMMTTCDEHAGIDPGDEEHITVWWR